jgi:hypothetical protein
VFAAQRSARRGNDGGWSNAPVRWLMEVFRRRIRLAWQTRFDWLRPLGSTRAFEYRHQRQSNQTGRACVLSAFFFGAVHAAVKSQDVV